MVLTPQAIQLLLHSHDNPRLLFFFLSLNTTPFLTPSKHHPSRLSQKKKKEKRKRKEKSDQNIHLIPLTGPTPCKTPTRESLKKTPRKI